MSSSPQPRSTASNTAPYGAVAQEYYDPRLHPTCYNFNRLSRIFISKHLLPQGAHRRILEVGAGESSAAPLLEAAGHSLSALTLSDSSQEMLAHSARWHEKGAGLVVGDAEHLRSWAPPTECVVASLGDPYNTMCFWEQLGSLLPPGGAVIFTLPSYEWAGRFRRADQASQHTAEFVTRSGQVLSMPSYIPPLAGQVEIIENAGLIVVDFEAMGRAALGSDAISPKLLGSTPEDSLVWGFVAIRLGESISAERRKHWPG